MRARQHKVAEVACYRVERTLMGCADPLRRGVGSPHQCPRVNPTTPKVDESSTSLACIAMYSHPVRPKLFNGCHILHVAVQLGNQGVNAGLMLCDNQVNLCRASLCYTYIYVLPNWRESTSALDLKVSPYCCRICGSFLKTIRGGVASYF